MLSCVVLPQQVVVDESFPTELAWKRLVPLHPPNSANTMLDINLTLKAVKLYLAAVGQHHAMSDRAVD